MNILISNDDGIDADGVKALTNVLCRDHNVVVCAPHIERSGASMSLTIHQLCR